MTHPDLTVDRARLAGAGLARGEVEQWLELVRVEALGLASNEILYVPRLPILLKSSPRTAPRRAAQMVLDRLRCLTESAERDPWRPYSGNGALRFSSPARYRAWLMALWLGGAAERATAIAATGTTTLREWQRCEVLRDGSALVAVSAHLAEARLAVDWLARFEPPDHELAEASLAQSFGIDLRADVLEARATDLPRPGPFARCSGKPQAGPADKPRDNSAAERDVAEHCGELSRAGNDWRKLSPRSRVLLLALVSLARAPVRASRKEYVSTLIAAAAGPSAGAMAESPVNLPPPPSIPSRSRAPQELRVVVEAHSVRVPVGRPEIPSQVAAADGPSITMFDESDARPSQYVHPPKSRTPLRETYGAEIASVQQMCFESNFAGLLFLLNALTGLGLYPDFASGSAPKLAVAPLWLIDRIGCFWFRRRYRSDPLHRWIAENSCGGHLPRDWNIEPAWLQLWKAGQRPFVIKRGDRLTVWDPRGFPIADTAVMFRHRISAAALHRRKLSRYHRGADRVPCLPASRSERWIACLAYFLDARIRLATGDPGMGLDALAQSGQVTIDELDVTAHFSFEPQTVPFRLAGLDRNPCWQPAEARSFKFHFS